jgi:elongation factor P
MYIEDGGSVVKILEIRHVKHRKGSAYVCARVADVFTGNETERDYQPNERFRIASIDRRELQYSYSEGDTAYFLDPVGMSIVQIEKSRFPQVFKYTTEGTRIMTYFYKGAAFRMDCPDEVVLRVVQTDLGVRDTGMKTAVVETGAQVSVPDDVNIGACIRIDTQTDTYLGLA